jgi:hypothetical protein
MVRDALYFQAIRLTVCNWWAKAPPYVVDSRYTTREDGESGRALLDFLHSHIHM